MPKYLHKPSNMKRLVLIDAFSLLHRAYFALPKNITTSKGDIVNAVYGFTRMLLKVIKDLKPDYMALAYDVKGPTFRDKIYRAYKEGRPVMEPELEGQLKFVNEVVEALNIPIFLKEGYEADDIIATLSERLKKDLEVLIVTGDVDLLQLVDEHIKVYAPKKGLSEPILYGNKEVKEKFGFSADKILDYKALRGDASDNIPGVKGIGEKSAVGLLKKYKNLDDVYKNINELDKKVSALLSKEKERAEMSRELAALKRDAPLEFNLKDLKLVLEKKKLLSVFKKLEFKSLIRQLEKEKKNSSESQDARGQLKLI